MRQEFIQKIAKEILSRAQDGLFFVGIDGVDGAGKTTFAEELSSVLKVQGRSVLRASIDGFHRPRSERVAKGVFSPEGYYEDSFDYPYLIKNLLRPLKEAEHPVNVHTSKFDFKKNEDELNEVSVSEPDTILVFEGVFLFRPELEKFWDFKIFVDVDFETSLKRGLSRDSGWMGGESLTEKKYRERYIPGQKIYFKSVDPKSKANLKFDNSDPNNPRVL